MEYIPPEIFISDDENPTIFRTIYDPVKLLFPLLEPGPDESCPVPVPAKVLLPVLLHMGHSHLIPTAVSFGGKYTVPF